MALSCCIFSRFEDSFYALVNSFDFWAFCERFGGRFGEGVGRFLEEETTKPNPKTYKHLLFDILILLLLASSALYIVIVITIIIIYRYYYRSCYYYYSFIIIIITIIIIIIIHPMILLIHNLLTNKFRASRGQKPRTNNETQGT